MAFLVGEVEQIGLEGGQREGIRFKGVLLESRVPTRHGVSLGLQVKIGKPTDMLLLKLPTLFLAQFWQNLESPKIVLALLHY